MELENILTLIQAVSESSLESFEFKEGDLKISLKKGKDRAQILTMATEEKSLEMSNTSSMELASVETSSNANKTLSKSEHVVKSPLVGTFYSSSSPDSEVFVKVGDCVKKGQTLGIIEAMKLMNEIECDYDGVVEAILIENEQVVEFGQPLFRIR